MIPKIKTLSKGFLAIVFLGMLFIPTHSSAADTLKPSDCPGTGLSTVGPFKGPPPTACKKDPANCYGGKLNIYNSDPKQNDDTKCQPLGNGSGDITKNPIVGDLNLIVNVLAGLVGVVVVGTIILGGVQFAAAGDKAERVSAAKQRIINGLTALAAFLFVYAFLQWLIPGGTF